MLMRFISQSISSWIIGSAEANVLADLNQLLEATGIGLLLRPHVVGELAAQGKTLVAARPILRGRANRPEPLSTLLWTITVGDA
jgi:hypothetical protein